MCGDIMIDKEKVKELYIKGYGYTSIATILNAKPETVRKCIQRNFKDFKTAHELSRLRDKEIDRVTRRECNQYMSNRNFILHNRSIYKANKNGDLVLNKDVAGAITFDTPKRLSHTIY